MNLIDFQLFSLLEICRPIIQMLHSVIHRWATNNMTRSSLFLELLLFLHSYYFAMFILLEICFGIFKMVTFPFQNNNVIMESFIMLFMVCIELVRIYLGRKGNLTESLLPLILSAVLTGPSVLGVVYLLLWQSYVIWLEVVFCYIQLTMQALEFILSLVSIGTFYKYMAY